MDILEKLREKQGYYERLGFEVIAAEYKEAADEIERLRGEKQETKEGE